MQQQPGGAGACVATRPGRERGRRAAHFGTGVVQHTLAAEEVWEQVGWRRWSHVGRVDQQQLCNGPHLLLRVSEVHNLAARTGALSCRPGGAGACLVEAVHLCDLRKLPASRPLPPDPVATHEVGACSEELVRAPSTQCRGVCQRGPVYKDPYQSHTPQGCFLWPAGVHPHHHLGPHQSPRPASALWTAPPSAAWCLGRWSFDRTWICWAAWQSCAGSHLRQLLSAAEFVRMPETYWTLLAAAHCQVCCFFRQAYLGWPLLLLPLNLQ